MARYYCIPDLHGRKDLLDKALEALYEQNPNGGKIVFLGDYIDRGDDSLGVVRTVMNPPEGWEFVCLMGTTRRCSSRPTWAWGNSTVPKRSRASALMCRCFGTKSFARFLETSSNG